MNKKTKFIVLGSVLILTFIMVLLVVIYNKPHTNVANSKADITLTAQTILNDFENDENNANAKYLEQIVEISGTISTLSINDNKGIIALKNEGSLGTVMCHLTPEETIKFKNLYTGKPVIIKGICTGYLMDVILVKCIIK
ncbi:OB-fold protein [Flavivirga jejuensis]|uniref:Nucleic acid binding protein n=1 Tax=Flavivirga jejuensis TaxID=870487 RepID=A0ABT8WQN1_9FLAO|nr:hypothetical protein [Flavivirga jejuensis]MDO5975470.1 hypothetical protein [Flavivirga jejuensis]